MEKPRTIQPGSDKPSVAKSPKSNRIQVPKKVYVLVRGMNAGITRIDLNVYDDASTDKKPVWVTLTVRALIKLLSERTHSDKMRDKLQRDSYDAAHGLPVEVSDNEGSKSESEGEESGSGDKESRSEHEESRSESKDFESERENSENEGAESESEGEGSESEGESERHAKNKMIKEEFDAPIRDKLQQDSLVNTEGGLSAGPGTQKFDVPTPLQLLEILQLDEEGVMSAVPQDALAKTCVSFFVGDDLEEDAVRAGEDDPRYRLIVFDDDDNVDDIREISEDDKGDLITDFLVKNDTELAAKNDSELAELYSDGGGSVRRLLILYHVVDARFFLRVLHEKGEHAELHFAAAKGYLTELVCLLGFTQDVDVRNGGGCTALYLAVKHGREGVVKALIGAGANVRAGGAKTEDTALHVCSKPGIAKCLISAGADLHARSKSGTTVLHHAAHFGRSEMVKYLIATGADVNTKDHDGSTALHHAAMSKKNDSLAIMETLIEAGADVNASTGKGFTALHISAKKGQLEEVKYLITAGADVDAKNVNDETALHFVHYGLKTTHATITQCLLDARASIDVSNIWGYTPLSLSIYHSSRECTDALLAAEPDVNAGTIFALFLAIQNSDAALVERLLRVGADANARIYGDAIPSLYMTALETAIYTVVIYGDADRLNTIVDHLISAGADVNANGEDSETPLDSLILRFERSEERAETDDPEEAKFDAARRAVSICKTFVTLRAAGAKVSAESDAGVPVLIEAEESKDPRVVRFLRRMQEELRK